MVAVVWLTRLKSWGHGGVVCMEGKGVKPNPYLLVAYHLCLQGYILEGFKRQSSVPSAWSVVVAACKPKSLDLGCKWSGFRRSKSPETADFFYQNIENTIAFRENMKKWVFEASFFSIKVGGCNKEHIKQTQPLSHILLWVGILQGHLQKELG